MLFPCLASAQAPDDSNNSVHVGDQWTYDTKDEITGTVTRTYTATVSEITPKEISTHLTFRGRNGTALVVFDHEWNRIKNGNLEYKPHDANGVQFPLVVGKEWRLQFFTSNTNTGAPTSRLRTSPRSSRRKRSLPPREPSMFSGLNGK
jgi:hypothetical protein